MKIGLQIPRFTWSGGDAAIRPKLAEIGRAADAAGFAINEVVQCRLASGVATGSTRTIISIVGNVITLSGATAVPAGQTICFAAFPSQLTTQQSQYASMASGTTRQLTGGIAPFQYGEV